VSLRTSYHFVIAVWRTKKTKSARVNYWETIADHLGKAVGLGDIRLKLIRLAASFSRQTRLAATVTDS
jgi:hypothetical protein